MPVVFVHGVNNRDGESYRENEFSRNGFLREIVAPALGLVPDELSLLSPYWGQYGGNFAWGMASLPDPAEKPESFGAEAIQRVAGLIAESESSGKIVLDAQKEFAGAVDLLYASAMAGAKSEEEARDLAKSYVLSAQYAQKEPQPAWIATATPDNFADQLDYAADASRQERFGAGGILQSLKEGLSRLEGAAGAATSALGVRVLRKNLNATVTRFAGDAFVYLNSRIAKDGKPGPIVATLIDDLLKARQACTHLDNKLIVIAHSFGGEIMYDIATHFAPDIKVDCLITVASQVGLFEEMKLYVESRVDIPPDPPKGHIARPQAVQRWLNVFDTNDVLSYRLEPIMSDVADFYYNTGFNSLSAHGGYFMRPSFYQRIAARLSGEV